MDPSYSLTDLSHQMSDCSIDQPCDSSSPAWLPSIPPSEPSSPSTTTSRSSFSAPTPLTPPMTPISAPVLGYGSSSRQNSYHSTNIRAQRQRAVRNQCTASHLAEISELVSRMVSSGEQCSVGSTSRPPSPEPIPTASPSHQPIHLARQNSDFSDGSVSPLSRISYEEDGDEDMDDIDEISATSNSENSTALDEGDRGFGQPFGDWQFSWSARAKTAETGADRQNCITKDTRSRKHVRRR